MTASDRHPRPGDTIEPPTLERRCEHADMIESVEIRTAGCETCLREGGYWVNLRICLTCGHVGCCDNSPGKHATAHYRGTGHPIILSAEPGETWVWCYPDDALLA